MASDCLGTPARCWLEWLSPIATFSRETKPSCNTRVPSVVLSFFSDAVLNISHLLILATQVFYHHLNPEVPAVRLCQRVLSATSNATLDHIIQGELDSAKVISLRTFHKQGNSTCKDNIYFNNYLVLLSLFSLFTTSHVSFVAEI
jgi:hypothetical protein